MKRILQIVSVLLGLFMIYAGVNHFRMPQFYLPFVPAFFPFREAMVLLSGGIEVAFGVAVLIPASRKWGAYGILLLMLAFLPVHVADLFRQAPAIGSHDAAIIRLPFQFVFIFWAWLAVKTPLSGEDAPLSP